MPPEEAGTALLARNLTRLTGASGAPKMGRAPAAARDTGPGPHQSREGAAAPPAPAEPLPRLPIKELLLISITALEQQ